MSEMLRMWIEIAFNVTYLIVVWVLVVAMIRRRSLVAEADQGVAELFIWAFGLLALGDTGHVGFRVVAYALDGLETKVNVLGRQVGLIGLGALATAITVTFFYVVMLMMWQRRFDQSYGWFGGLLFAAAAVRLVVMAFPQNGWDRAGPGPMAWSLYRNLPLMVQGLGVAALMLRDALAAKDRTFLWIAGFILTSYAFYAPVIFLVRRFPLVGMLMIPKTMAYVGIAVVGYLAYFRPEAAPARRDSRATVRDGAGD
jgi:hypothetical protein